MASYVTYHNSLGIKEVKVSKSRSRRAGAVSESDDEDDDDDLLKGPSLGDKMEKVTLTPPASSTTSTELQAQSATKDGEKSTSTSVMSAEEAEAFIAAREAEAAAEFSAAVEEWRVSKAEGGGKAVIAEAGGCFADAVASEAVSFAAAAAPPAPAPAPAPAASSTDSGLPPCPTCGTNTTVIKCVRGKPGPELRARAERGEVKLTGCCHSEKGWCTVCAAFV